MVRLDEVTQLRRARALACYWQDAELTIQNYLTHQSASAAPIVLELLDYCNDWRTLSEVFASFSALPRGPLRHLVSLLIRRTFLERRRADSAGQHDALDSWASWTPEAAFFHFATKDCQYGTENDLRSALVQKAMTNPPPAPVKAYPGQVRTALPAANGAAPLSKVLHERRTWRKFHDTARLDVREVATLLNLTWGIQDWAETAAGPCALKTSPSGGARHPTEVYVLVRAVTGLAAGYYYYDPDAHQLVTLKRGLRTSRLSAYLPSQDYYSRAHAVFIMTAVFARSQWRYELPRAYRVVLLDAGHLCQTFCLVATSLGLAPFCTAALADSTIERDLGIDGVTESVVYACGVGIRPTGVTWAPWPDTTAVPVLVPSKLARRSHKR